MRNEKFVKTVLWVIVLLVVAGLLLPLVTSLLGLF